MMALVFGASKTADPSPVIARNRAMLQMGTSSPSNPRSSRPVPMTARPPIVRGRVPRRSEKNPLAGPPITRMTGSTVRIGPALLALRPRPSTRKNAERNTNTPVAT